MRGQAQRRQLCIVEDNGQRDAGAVGVVDERTVGQAGVGLVVDVKAHHGPYRVVACAARCSSSSGLPPVHWRTSTRLRGTALSGTSSSPRTALNERLLRE